MPRRSLLELPSGVQFVFGEEAQRHRRVERLLGDVFTRAEYQEVIAPLIDYAEVFSLLDSNGGAGSSYRFIGHDGEVMSVRADFTALIAKLVVSRLAPVDGPLRLFYRGDVVRHQPPGAGRQDEMFQIGLERVGGEGELQADQEVLSVAIRCLRELGLDDALVTLGHVGIVTALFGVDGGANLSEETWRAVRKRDVHTLRKLGECEHLGLLEQFFSLVGDARDVLDSCDELVLPEPSQAAAGHLRRVVSELEAETGWDRFRIDLGSVGDIDYYSGIVFDIDSPRARATIGAGGRYDDLLGRFGASAPAVGFSFSLDRLRSLLEPSGLAGDERRREGSRSRPASDSPDGEKRA